MVPRKFLQVIWDAVSIGAFGTRPEPDSSPPNIGVRRKDLLNPGLDDGFA